MYKFIDTNYKELSDLVILKLANQAMSVINLMYFNSNFLKYIQDYHKVVQILNRYFYKTIKLQEYPLTVKLLLIATKVHPLFYMKLISLFDRRRLA